MSDKKRYHIHVCLVRNENSHLEDAIAYALSADYFLTWDLLPTHKSFVEYSFNPRTRVGCESPSSN